MGLLQQPFLTNKYFPAPPLPAFPSLGDAFKIVKEPSEECSAVVVEADVEQDGVKLYIALDSKSYGHTGRPGNGGIRLLNYETTQCAIDDAVRLAKGMTRKHDMFRTGFSGAKVVVKSDHEDLSVIERKELMEDVASALDAFDGGGMYTGCDLNTGDAVSPFSRFICAILVWNSSELKLFCIRIWITSLRLRMIGMCWLEEIASSIPT